MSHPGVGRARRGFTLIELMIVVVIAGVLAVLALVGYRKLITGSHLSEATNTVASIRVAQEAFHAEAQQYAKVSANLTSYYPQTSPRGNLLTAWGVPCGSACGPGGNGVDWTWLPLHVDGPVLFGYATIGGLPSEVPSPASVTVNGVSNPLTPPATDWYVIAAHCDLDSDGDGVDTTVYSVSWTNQLAIDHEGQ